MIIHLKSYYFPKKDNDPGISAKHQIPLNTCHGILNFDVADYHIYHNYGVKGFKK